MWFAYSLAAAVLWGGADLFYKKAADDGASSHLKTTVAVGLVMGLHAGYLLIFGGSPFSLADIIRYLPVSALYISSMIVGYIGLRYLELSIASPVQNASGAVSALLCFIFFTHVLKLPEIAGILLITAGLLFLGIIENRADRRIYTGDKKYSRGFLAIVFPLVYCLLDGLGTFADAVYLDELELISEDAALVAYELTFFAVAVAVAFYLFVIKKEKTFLSGRSKYAAAALETAGQYFYVFAMADTAIFAAPLIASYSIFSAIFAAIFLGERLTKRQYIAVAAVVAGIVALGFAE